MYIELNPGGFILNVSSFFSFSYSLCRFSSKDEGIRFSSKDETTRFTSKSDARTQFELYKCHFPVILALDPDLCNLVSPDTSEVGTYIILKLFFSDESATDL